MMGNIFCGEYRVPEKESQGTMRRKISPGYTEVTGLYLVVIEKIVMVFKETSNIFGSMKAK